jgi:hypothetical protein
MNDWCYVRFENSEPVDQPSIHPDLIQQAQDVYRSTGEKPDFCILVNWHTDGKSIIRDYYFSPTAIYAWGAFSAFSICFLW